ncbi:MAG: sulfite exporter TauE/SafE family protein [Chloroflexi bacterium]|nr:sulfite exporter TauE/SafE family protein [Chloroflexota bacterium]
MVGLGGGFAVVPVLIIFYNVSPQHTIGTTLTVVFFNSVSGTIAFARQKRIDYITGIRFALATLPGAALGAYAANYFSPPLFNVVFGGFLVSVAVFLIVRPLGGVEGAVGLSCAPLLPRSYVTRTVVDATGQVFRYCFQERRGLALSFFVGFLSSMLGIGGGVIHVPALVYLFSFPPHIATATSQFILAVSSMAGSGFHLALGHVLYLPAVLMGVAAVAGAQGGAAVSRRLKGKWLVRALAPAFLAAGIRLLMTLRG